MNGYGNEQAQYTLNRASYGDVPAGMMQGMRTTAGGAYDGMNNMLSDIGRSVMPVSYTPNARVSVGFYGQYQQQTGFFSSAAGVTGIGGPGRSQMASDYMYNTASDFGERLGGGTAGLAATVGSMGIGSLMGRMLGGGIVGSLAGGFVGSAAAGVVMDAVGQRREISNYLENSSYRYTTSGSGMSDSRHGGMNARSRSQVGEMIRGMDIKDPFMSTEDLSMVLQQGTQKGLFAGTSDMGDFKKKFKDLTDAVKTVAKTLNQTLEESMSTIKELKSIGVDPSQVSNVVKSASTLGHMAGRTGAEMLNVGLQGAELFRGTGINMGVGAQATMMNLATVRASRDAGQLSNEAVAQAGGEEALAMRMNASGLGFAQSTIGRGFGAAFMGTGGGFDASKFMGNAMSGNMSLIGMATQAAGNLSSPKALIAYQANEAKFMSEMGKTFGGQGLQISQMMTIAAQSSFLSGATGAKFEDSYRLSAKQMGKTDSEIDTDFAQMRGANKIYKSGNAAAQMTYEKGLIEEAYLASPLVNVGSKVRDWGKSVVDTVAKPISDMIDSVKESAIGFAEEQAYGVRRRGFNSESIAYTTKTATNNDQRVKVKSIDQGGYLGGMTAGKVLNNELTDDMKKAFGVATREISNASELRVGETIIRDHNGGAKIAANMDDIAAKTKNWNFSKDDVTKAAEKNLLTTPESIYSKILGSSKDVRNIGDISEAVYGKRADQLTKEQTMSLYSTLKDHATYGSMVEKGRSFAGAAGNATNAVNAERLITAGDAYDNARDSYKNSVGGRAYVSSDKLKHVSDSTFVKMADASRMKDPKEAAKVLQEVGSELMVHLSAADTKAVMSAGANETTRAGNLVNAQNMEKQAALSLGSSRLSSMIESQLGGAALTTSEAAQASRVATTLGGLSGPNFVKDFTSIVGKNAELLKKSGSTGMAVVNTLTNIEKLQKLDDKDIAGAKEVLGDGFTPDMVKTARSGGNKAVIEKVLTDMQTGTIGNSVISAGGGTNKDGPNAADTMTQQMNMNTATLQVMQGLAKKLGVQ